MTEPAKNRDRNSSAKETCRVRPDAPSSSANQGHEPQGETNSPPDNRPIREKVLAAIDLIKNGAVFDEAVSKNTISPADFLEAIESDPDIEAAFIHAKEISHKILAERAIAVFQKNIMSNPQSSEAIRSSSALLDKDGPLANDPNSEPVVPPAMAELAKALAEKKGNLTNDCDR